MRIGTWTGWWRARISASVGRHEWTDRPVRPRRSSSAKCTAPRPAHDPDGHHVDVEALQHLAHELVGQRARASGSAAGRGTRATASGIPIAKVSCRRGDSSLAQQTGGAGWAGRG